MRFVIADVSGYMTDVLYNDIIGDPKYIIINKRKIYNIKLLNDFCQANISLRINRKHRMPLKMFFYKKIFGHFTNSRDLVFYFGIFWYDPDLIKYIKSKYPNAKLVFNFHDTVDSKVKLFKNLSVEIILIQYNIKL